MGLAAGSVLYLLLLSYYKEDFISFMLPFKKHITRCRGMLYARNTVLPVAKEVRMVSLLLVSNIYIPFLRRCLFWWMSVTGGKLLDVWEKTIVSGMDSSLY